LARLTGGPTLDSWIACGFLVICFVLGGSSRFQLVSHMTLRLVSIVAIGYAVFRMSSDRRMQTRPFARGVLLLGAVMALQLIPLPPGLWANLPGHGFYEDALQSVGLADRWRPVSMAPDLTLNSMLALLPALAAAMVFAPLNKAGRRLLLNMLLVCLACSALLSALQLASDGFYLYPRNNEGTGVGFFANRNHQALFLAIGIVLIMARWRFGEHPGKLTNIGATLGLAVVVLAFLTVTGSRAGLVAGVIAFVAGGWVYARGTLRRQTRWIRIGIPLAALMLLVAAFALGFVSSRQVAVQRLLQTGATLGTTELRTANLPAMMEMAGSFFPVGTGFGTFDAVFRRFESEALLRPTYFNHAHSEPIELLIEGGVPAMLLLVLGLVWLAKCGRVLLVASAKSPTVLRAQAGVLGLLLLAAGSLVDYPLRTPFLAVLAILLATWAAEKQDEASSNEGRGLGTIAGMR
jgi:lipoprotein signal peptidase